MTPTRVLLVVALVVRRGHCHSWLECTDYQAKTLNDSNYYNPAVCEGYARCGDIQKAAGFGIDTGFNYHPTVNKQCQCGKGAKSNLKVAVYSPGERVCLAYPAKNHVAATCTNRYIPDNGVTIRRTSSMMGGDLSSEYVRNYTSLNGY